MKEALIPYHCQIPISTMKITELKRRLLPLNNSVVSANDWLMKMLWQKFPALHIGASGHYLPLWFFRLSLFSSLLQASSSLFFRQGFRRPLLLLRQSDTSTASIPAGVFTSTKTISLQGPTTGQGNCTFGIFGCQQAVDSADV